MRGNAVSFSFSGARITAVACVLTSFAWNFLEVKKAIWPGAAPSSEPTWRIWICGSPATRPPRREVICPSVNGPGMPLFGGRLTFQRLDHLFGDIDARADIGRHLLEDDVELFLLGDLADHAVRRLHHLGQLLVAALVQVFAELALLALELPVHLAELALLVAALGLGHGHGVLVEVLLHALELRGDAGQLAIALLEFRLDLLLRRHRRGGVAQDALGVHEAELAHGYRLRGRGRGQDHKSCRQSYAFDHQKPVPNVNCNCCTRSWLWGLSGLPSDSRSGPIGEDQNSARPVE